MAIYTLSNGEEIEVPFAPGEVTEAAVEIDGDGRAFVFGRYKHGRTTHDFRVKLSHRHEEAVDMVAALTAPAP